MNYDLYSNVLDPLVDRAPIQITEKRFFYLSMFS